jgi:hypothetical protein
LITAIRPGKFPGIRPTFAEKGIGKINVLDRLESTGKHEFFFPLRQATRAEDRDLNVNIRKVRPEFGTKSAGK